MKCAQIAAKTHTKGQQTLVPSNLNNPIYFSWEFYFKQRVELEYNNANLALLILILLLPA
ncbi:MAG: hypothetical protein ACJAYB_002457 [Psychromonas sp.]|jgi:hypothetical protein